MAGEVRWGQAVYGYDLASGDDRVFDKTDSRRSHARARSSSTPAFDWADDHRPRTPWHDTDYLRDSRPRPHAGVTPRSRRLNAARMPAWRTRRCIDHFQRLGITAVELMPVHQFVDDHDAGEAGAAQLLGLQLDQATSPPTTATPPARANVS